MLNEFKKSRIYTSFIKPSVWFIKLGLRSVRHFKVDRLLDRNLGQHEAIEKPLLLRARIENEDKYSEKEPLVSINIPTYSRGKLLIEKTLPSIFAQTYERYEVVIVGDHCADNTEELIKKLNHAKVRFYDLPARPVYPKNQRKRWMV